MISPDITKPITRHINTILNIPNPKTLRQLRSLLGKFNYYAKHVENHAAIIAPLSEFTKGNSEDPKNVPNTFTPEALEAIKAIKKMLTQAPALGFPDFYSREPLL